MSAETKPPYWELIAVLFSSLPLTPPLAMCLHEAAYALYCRHGSVQQVAGDLISGTVRSLGQDVQLGSIGGPAFEAEVETERGKARVRFVLTRQGLRHLEQTRPELLN